MLAVNTPIDVVEKAGGSGNVRRILLAVNKRSAGARLFELAARLATRDRCHVDVVHLQERVTQPTKTHLAIELETFEEAVDFTSLVQAELRELGVVAQIHVGRESTGREASQILEAAAGLGSHLLIAGSSPKSRLGAVLRGSTARDLVRQARIPVLLVPNQDRAA